jgi:hypothetical protein
MRRLAHRLNGPRGLQKPFVPVRDQIFERVLQAELAPQVPRHDLDQRVALLNTLRDDGFVGFR